MKANTAIKMLLILAGAVGALVALFFYVVPERVVSRTILMHTNHNSLRRFLGDDAKTGEWWKTFLKDSKKHNVVLLGFTGYYLSNKIKVKMKVEDHVTSSEMSIIPAGANASYLTWQLDLPVSKNPIYKLKMALGRNAIGNELHEILLNLRDYARLPKHIYGLSITRMKVKDTLIAVARSSLKEPPTTAYIYNQIAGLKQYLRQHHAKELSFPMLRVSMMDKDNYELFVGIPIDKPIAGTKTIGMQRMVAGDILRAECRGGTYSIQKAFREVENYMHDNQNSSPALPFESLVTDRAKEPDTSKWITEIFYPVY